MTLSIALLLIFAATLAFTFVLAKVAPKLGLIAQPGEHRVHQNATPMVGGIAIFLGLVLGLILIDGSFSRLLPSLLIMCVVGLLDDRYKLPSWCRFIAQGLAAYLIISLCNIQLLDLGMLFDSTGRVLLNRYWSIGLTIFACIGVINAINMSDGLDGLAGALVFIVLLSLLFMGHLSASLILISLASVAGFLFWNIRVGRSAAKAFMGDAGSTMLGLLLATLLIQFSQAEKGMYPVTALWLLALPLIDAVAVLIVRPLRGRSPFSADRMHYHHQLLDRGWSVNVVLLVSCSLQLMFIAIGVSLLHFRSAEHLQLYAFLTLFGLYLARLYYFSGKSRAQQKASE